MISLCKGKRNRFMRYALVTIGLGVTIQHLCAIVVMCLHNGGNVQAAIVTVSLPFLFGDVIKCMMASVLAVKVNKVLTRV